MPSSRPIFKAKSAQLVCADPRLDWAVIVERPVEEAYEALYASMLRTSALFLIGLGMALFASYFLARRVVRPVRILAKASSASAPAISAIVSISRPVTRSKCSPTNSTR